MNFIVEFYSKHRYGNNSYFIGKSKNVGIKHIELMKKMTNNDYINISLVNNHIYNCRPKSIEITVSENKAYEINNITKLFDYNNRISVNTLGCIVIPEKYFYYEIVYNERERKSLYCELKEELIINDWIKDGCPEEWEKFDKKDKIK